MAFVEGVCAYHTRVLPTPCIESLLPGPEAFLLPASACFGVINPLDVLSFLSDVCVLKG